MKRRFVNGMEVVVLSRRNLLALMAKLDGFPSDSACTIIGGTDARGMAIKAEEDNVHYADRPWGKMVPETERRIRS